MYLKSTIIFILNMEHNIKCNYIYQTLHKNNNNIVNM